MRYLEVGPLGCFCGSVSIPETLLASLLRPQDSCCGSHLMSSSDEISPQEWELMGCVEVHIASPCCTNTSLQNSAAQKSRPSVPVAIRNQKQFSRLVLFWVSCAGSVKTLAGAAVF